MPGFTPEADRVSDSSPHSLASGSRADFWSAPLLVRHRYSSRRRRDSLVRHTNVSDFFL
jgi:hypothetical protein